MTTTAPAIAVPPAFPAGQRGERPVIARSGRAARPVLLVCGDLGNLGDLALAAQNIALAHEEGRQVIVRTWGTPPPAVREQLASWGARWVDGRSLGALIKAARGADMVLGGGELIRSNTALRALAWLRAAAAAVQAGGGRIDARGLGAGPVHGVRRQLWRGILGSAASVCARDARSLANLRDLLPHAAPVLTADMAFLGERLPRLAAGTASPFPGAIVIAPCVDRSEARTIAPAALGALVAQARRMLPDAPLVFACHDERDGMDGDAARAIIAGAGIANSHILGTDGRLAPLLALYREAALVITNRLHAGIFSVLLDRPLLVLDDGNPKLGILTGSFAIPAASASAVTAEADLGHRLAEALAFAPAARQVARAAMQAAAQRNLGVHRTAIFNVKYSPNLGDGIIAECLEGELRRSHPGIEPLSIDLAGRDRFDVGHGRHRGQVLSLLERLPHGLRARLMPPLLSLLVGWRLKPRFQHRLQGCDAAVIGGGALFADADQNFPIKLATALGLCNRQGIGVAVASVGVSGGWSAGGMARVVRQLHRARLLSITVRDGDSVLRWHRLFSPHAIPDATLAPDPGLLAATQYGLTLRKADACATRRPIIGLCITGPLALRLHGATAEHDDSHLEAWLQRVAHGLASSGCTVVLFTNGSPEDRAFRDRLAEIIGPLPGVEAAADFATPGELARAIAGFDCVLAHRLHACIVAYSCRIPSIGFAWDRKLNAFFNQTGRPRFMIDPRETSPMDAADLALAAIDEGIDPAVHQRLVDWSRAEIATLGERLLAGRQTDD